MENGLIFDIQGYSVHDGPGCRTLVFLNGCPLQCSWCANPEGRLLHPRLLYRASKCVHKHYSCIEACPDDAILLNDQPPILFKPERCETCDSMECARACMNQALAISGKRYTVDELMRVLQRDQSYWGEQGGVTFTGGEPLVQADFLLTVLKQCRIHYMHTAMETCAQVETKILLDMLAYLDWLFIDLKHMSPEAHHRETGCSNDLILHNIAAAASATWEGRLMLRVPFIPGYNDDEENLSAIIQFMNEINLNEINLLSFHRLGNSKYEQLGLPYSFANTPSPSRKEMLTAQAIFTAAGIHCYLDYETPD